MKNDETSEKLLYFPQDGNHEIIPLGPDELNEEALLDTMFAQYGEEMKIDRESSEDLMKMVMRIFQQTDYLLDAPELEDIIISREFVLELYKDADAEVMATIGDVDEVTEAQFDELSDKIMNVLFYKVMDSGLRGQINEALVWIMSRAKAEGDHKLLADGAANLFVSNSNDYRYAWPVLPVCIVLFDDIVEELVTMTDIMDHMIDISCEDDCSNESDEGDND